MRNSFQDIPEMNKLIFCTYNEQYTETRDKPCASGTNQSLSSAWEQALHLLRAKRAARERVSFRVVLSRDFSHTRKWRACSQVGLLFALNVILNLCNDES